MIRIENIQSFTLMMNCRREPKLNILFQVLIEHIEEQNVDGYTEAIKEYDSVSRLDQWYTTILLRIKKQLNDNPDLR